MSPIVSIVEWWLRWLDVALLVSTKAVTPIDTTTHVHNDPSITDTSFFFRGAFSIQVQEFQLAPLSVLEPLPTLFNLQLIASFSEKEPLCMSPLQTMDI